MGYPTHLTILVATTEPTAVIFVSRFPSAVLLTATVALALPCSSVFAQETAPPAEVEQGADPASPSDIAPPEATNETDEADPATPNEEPTEATTTAGPTAIEFNFREMPWMDVLDWFAKQSDMSLTVQELPPGKFTYSDTQQYTPNEAINLLNGVLSPRGFTLIRRGRLLICVKISDGLPLDLIPETTKEQLGDYGQHEFVKLMFQLDGRPAEAVMEEMQPILGQQGTVAALPQTGRLLVTATAGRMRAIEALIESIPKPKRPEKPKPKPKPPGPVLQQHSLENVDADAALEMLETMASGKMTVDPKTKILHVYAPPKNQEVVASILKQMADAASGELKPTLKIYEVNEESLTTLARQVQLVVPDVTIQPASDPARLLVVAPAAKHEEVQKTLDQLDAGASSTSMGGATSIATVYELKHVAPDQAQEVVTKVFSRAKTTVDSEARRLIVVATPEQQVAIEQLVTKLDTPPNAQTQIRRYPLGKVRSDRALEILQPAVPNAKLTIDASAESMTAVGSEAEHEQIESILQQLAEIALPDASQTVRRYEVTRRLKDQFNRIYKTLDPTLASVRLLDANAPDQLLVLGTAVEHARVSAAIEQVKATLPDETEKSIKRFAVTRPLKDQFNRLHRTLDPGLEGLQLLDSGNADELLVLGTAEEHEQVEVVLDQIKASMAAETERRFQRYEVTQQQRDQFNRTFRTLDPALDGLQQLDAGNDKQLLVLATDEQHQRVAAVLEQIREQFPAAAKQLVTYDADRPLQQRFERFRDQLDPTLGPIDILQDDDRLAVVATSTQHEKIAAILQQLGQAPDAPETRLKIYAVTPTQRQRFDALLPSLEEPLKSVKIIDESRPRELAVWGTAEQHAELEKLLPSLITDDSPTPLQFVSYGIKEGEPQAIQAVLQELFPDVKILIDERSKRVMAWGTAEQQTGISSAVEQLDKPAAAGDKRMAYYRVENVDVRDVERMMSQMLPEMMLSSDRSSEMIVAWGTQEDQKKLAIAIEDFKRQNSAQAYTVISYPMGSRDPFDMRRMLDNLVPRARMTIDSGNRSLVVWASPDDHKVLSNTLKQLDAAESIAPAEMRVYATTRITTAELNEIIDDVVPAARTTTSADGKQVFVWAHGNGHQQIAAALKAIESADPAAEGTELKAHAVPNRLLARVRELLPDVAPTARPLESDTQDTLLVWAASKEQTAIGKMIESVIAAAPETPKLLKRYPLDPDSVDQARTLITNQVPGVSFLDAGVKHELLLQATESDHAKVAKLLEELAEVVVPAPQVNLQVYATGEQEPQTVLAMLPADLTSDVTIIPDAARGALLVRATAEQHAQLAPAIQGLVEQLPPEKKPVSKVYRLEHASASSVGEAIAELMPGVEISVDSTTRRVAVVALPEQHELIQATVSQLDQAPDQTLVSRSFRVRGSVRGISSALEDLFTSSKIATDYGNDAVLVTTTPEEMKRIEEVINNLDGAGDGSRVTKVYTLQSADAQAVDRAITPLVPDATVITGRESNMLFVTAEPEDQEKVAAVIQQIDEDAPQQIAKIYPLRRTELSAARDTIRGLVPRAEVEADFQGRRLLVTATQEDHDRIAPVITQIESNEAINESTVVYSVKFGDLESLENALDDLLDDADVVADEESRAILVTATAEDHKRAADVIKQLAESAGGNERKTRVYRMQVGDVDAARDALLELFPNSVVVADDDADTLLVSGREEDLKAMGEVIDQLQQVAGSSRITRVYPLSEASLNSTQNAIERLLPEAYIAIEESTRSLIVTATEEDHQRVREVIQQIDQLDTAASGKETKAYPLAVADVAAARDAIQALLPEATLSADQANRSLIVTAKPQQHANVERVLATLDQPNSANKITRGYRFDHGDVTAAQGALSNLLPRATFTVDTTNRTLLVTGTEEDHQRVTAVLEDLDAVGEDQRTVAYTLALADPAAVQRILEPILKGATFASDGANKTLVANATEVQHVRIKEIVESMDAASRGSQYLQAYPVRRADVRAASDTLNRLYERDPRVLVSSDDANKTVLVKASAEEHQRIAQIVAQLENGAAGGIDRRMIVYNVQARDPNQLKTTLEGLLRESQPPVEFSVDVPTRTIVAVATPEQHEILKEAVEQFQQDSPELDVFPLFTADPFSVELAITQLFADEASKPIVSGDSSSQQLFVRGTQEQLQQVRQLLVKMGELPPTDSVTRDGMRVVPFRGDMRDAIQQIQQVWPKLRGNEMRVINPRNSDGSLRPAGPSIEINRAEDTNRGALQPTPVDENGEPTREGGTDASEEEPNEIAPPRAPEPEPEPLEQDARLHARPEATLDSTQTFLVATESETALSATAESEGASDEPPIFVVPGNGTVTLLSDDEAALQQAESLLRTIMRQAQSDNSAGNFAVFTLRNAGARNVSKLIVDLFEQMPITARATLGRVSMVPDERLNAVVVHGRAADRAVIAELLRVLDSDNVPDSLANARPRIVPIEYLKARQVMEILQGVYKAQLESGRNRPEIEIPEGVDRDVASVLQQLNASASAPLLTLEVDDVTNSIVVLAPTQLSGEVSDLIAKIDRNARDNDKRRIGIVPLRVTNVKGLEQAINQLLGDR